MKGIKIDTYITLFLVFVIILSVCSFIIVNQISIQQKRLIQIGNVVAEIEIEKTKQSDLRDVKNTSKLIKEIEQLEKENRKLNRKISNLNTINYNMKRKLEVEEKPKHNMQSIKFKVYDNKYGVIE